MSAIDLGSNLENKKYEFCAFIFPGIVHPFYNESLDTINIS